MLNHRFLTKTFLLATLALPAAAEEVVILDVCQDGLAAAYEAEMAEFLAGNWRMAAAGTGYTTGTNKMPVRLSANGNGQLVMSGGGQSVTLNPLRYTNQDDGTETQDAPFDMSVESMTVSGLTKEELSILTECSEPTRYWWSFGSAENKSWGGLMFYDKNTGTGFMANSAGGTRRVVLQR